MKTIFALLLSLVCSVAFAAPAIDQIGTVGNWNFGATATSTLTGVAAGATIVTCSIALDTSGTAHSIAVSDGTAYTAAIQNDYLNGSNTFQSEIHYRQNVASGTYSVVGTNGGGSNSFGYFVAASFTGISNTGVDVTNANQNAGSTNPTSGSVIPNEAASLSVACATLNSISNPATFGDPPPGFTTITVQTNGSSFAVVGAADYLILSSSSAQDPSWATFSAANPWSATIAVFKGAGAPGGGSTGGLMMRGIGRLAPRDLNFEPVDYPKRNWNYSKPFDAHYGHQRVM